MSLCHPQVVSAFNGSVLDLSCAEILTCGAKAYSCGQLAQLSLQAKNGNNYSFLLPFSMGSFDY